jgi:dihydrofolate synthase/folylpolyglutamate synthase
MSYAAAIDQLSAMTPELYTQPGHARRKFSLAEIGTLLAAFGNPHHRFRSVLIAGTNGKGSTASTLASILAVSGLHTGLYTSPHLTRPNERIRIHYAEIGDDDFARLYFRVHDCAQQLVLDQKLAQLPSFFETLTAMAFLYFAEATIDIAVLEVGMGGRLDATNIVDPLLSIVTDIALDHTEWLGPTIAAIAREKAGILRPYGTLITLPQHPEANQILGEVANELKVRGLSAVPFMPGREGYRLQPLNPSLVGNKGASAQEPANSLEPLAASSTSDNFARAVSIGSYPIEVLGTTVQVVSPLQGAHQHRNIALAVAAAVELATHHAVPITPASIEQGIRATLWPGRLEQIVTHDPAEPAPKQWILDVAHNPAGAWALRAALRTLLRLGEPDTPPATLVFSCLRDKPVAEMAQILFPLFDDVIFAPIASARASPIADLLVAAATTGTPARAAVSVGEALAFAGQSKVATSNSAGRVSTVAVVAGSVYLVGEARPLLLARVGANP